MSLTSPIPNMARTDARTNAPARVPASQADTHDRRNHLAACLGMGLSAAVITTFYLVISAPVLLISVMALCTAGWLGLAVAVRSGVSLRLATVLTLTLMFTVCTTIPFYYGGVNFAGNAWFLVIPITAASMRSPRMAGVTTIGLWVVCALVLAAGELDLLPEPVFSAGERAWMGVVNLMVVAVVLLTIGRLNFLSLQARTEKVQAVNQLLRIEAEGRRRIQKDLERTRSELMEAARFAGRAEVATGVLHNLGNALTSVSVSTVRAASLLQQQRIGRVDDLARLLEGHDDPRLAAFAKVLAKDLRRTQEAAQSEMEAAVEGVEHVANVVAVQQEHARHCGLAEPVILEEEVHKAMVLVDLPGPHVVTVEGGGTAVVDRHRLLQILGNLMKNAKDAISENAGPGNVTVTISADAQARIVVSDNGVGIDPGHIERVFAHGFTTKRHGSGFGLHASALAAHEIHGSLNVESSGVDGGATFELTFPLYPTDGRNSIYD
ncbi:MAG: signal transduction histidine kinase [Myxococcota bacterium]|jgi:signal transduction histidine kinase